MNIIEKFIKRWKDLQAARVADRDRKLEIAEMWGEINGGTFTKGAHSTGTGIRRDYEKNNLAQLAGWRCLMFDGEMVRSGEAVEMVRKALQV